MQGTGEFTDVPIGFVGSTGEIVNTRVEGERLLHHFPRRSIRIKRWTQFWDPISIPIFNAFGAKNNVKRSKINLARSEYAKEQQQLELETNINQAYNDAEGAATFMKLLKKRSKQERLLIPMLKSVLMLEY